jgi:hypothetical protein
MVDIDRRTVLRAGATAVTVLGAGRTHSYLLFLNPARLPHTFRLNYGVHSRH